MRRITWFDMLVYRLFYWRWMPILIERPDVLSEFQRHISGWRRQETSGTQAGESAS
jgi:hypothetical protein